MSLLPTLIGRIAGYLGDGIEALALAGSRHPADADELPAVALSLFDVANASVGIGRKPVTVSSGALPVAVDIDLANPVLDFPEESVVLLSGDRQVLQLPHGPLVRADGTGQQPFGVGDLEVRLDGGAPLVPVEGEPAAGQVGLDLVQAALRFADPLPAAGTLSLAGFVGVWEVESQRISGELRVELFAADETEMETVGAALAEALSRDRALAGIEGLQALAPLSWGPARPAEGAPANALGRSLGFSFDFELSQPLIASGGGVITRVRVESTTDTALESFDVLRAVS